MTSIDFATFCHAGDAHRLHRPGQLRRQVESNGYEFNKVIVIHQLCNPFDYENPMFEDCNFKPDQLKVYTIDNLDHVLQAFDIDLNRQQYESDTDKAHVWKFHVVNHLAAVSMSEADFIVFADIDCWMVQQPAGESWVDVGRRILSVHNDIFIVSPNDGEPERRSRRMSQQMFLARTDEFRDADFNQPGWDGDVNIPGGPFPEYWGMLEGRMELYCRAVGKYRYVLPPEYRGWHFNRINPDTDHFEMDMEKYR